MVLNNLTKLKTTVKKYWSGKIFLKINPREFENLQNSEEIDYSQMKQ